MSKPYHRLVFLTEFKNIVKEKQIGRYINHDLEVSSDNEISVKEVLTKKLIDK